MELFDVYPLYDITPVKANDVFVYDQYNTEYLDLYGGHAVISIGHSHPTYVKALQSQIAKIGFYSNAIQNPLQKELANKLGTLSACQDYQLFLCNSGAEANENALKTASFITGKKGVLAFKNSFHGRTSASVSVTDNPKINAPISLQHQVTFVTLGALDEVEKNLKTGTIGSVIIEFIQGVGGLDESTPHFYENLSLLCKKYNALLIADEVQSGYGRTGKFFAFQHYDVQPDLITVAKGMGNGFPIAGVLIHPDIKPWHGMLGTTFGGNHLACVAGIAVLDTLKSEKLMDNAQEISRYFMENAQKIKSLKNIKGKGLMLGLEFDFDVTDLRKQLITEHKIFTGNSNNKNLIRILPPLTIKKHHIDTFFNALQKILKP